MTTPLRSTLLAAVAGAALIAGACGAGGPTSAERPDDDNLDPSLVAPATPSPVPTPTPNTTDYTIVAGDTLSGIAERFGVGVDELLEANGMTVESVLNLGEIMRVPIPPPSTEASPDDATLVLDDADRVLTSYTVAAGDTLGSIASRFDTTIDVLVEINELPAGVVLNVGDELQVPVPSGSAAETAPEGPVPAPGTNRIDIDEYVVVTGDSLGSIAARFGVTLGELLEANNLTSNSVLQVGQVLTIPEI